MADRPITFEIVKRQPGTLGRAGVIKWDNERSDYIEFMSEFAPVLERIPGPFKN